MILLDTNVLINFDNYQFDAQQSYAASVLSRAELALGTYHAPSVPERQKRQAILAAFDAQFDWLPFDRAASDGYGAVTGQSSLTGARLRNKDALLAGQAFSLGLAIMTANTKDFAPFAEQIEIIAPTRRIN